MNSMIDTIFVFCKLFKIGVRQMQTADLQTHAWVSQTRTSVSQTSASVSQTSTLLLAKITLRLDCLG